MAVGHRFDPTLLREYDLRGIVGETLGRADALALGRAFAAYVTERHKSDAPSRLRVCVGRDGRHSSPELAARVIEGLVASGVDVLDVGLGPTPLLYFAVHELGADGGIMVTGSHNAPAYNGFKLTAAKAKPVFGAEIIALGRLAAEARFVSGEGSSRTVDLRERYVHRLSRCLSEERAPPLRVAWDAGNGATGEVLARLVATLPGEHIVLNGAIDGGFPSHHPDPTVPANLRQLIDTVTARTLDLGIAFDGDGDRIGVVDGQGRIVWGDQLVALLARDLAVRTSDAPATVILDIKSSAASTFAIERGGARALLWKTGHSLIKAKMAETGAPLAGEMSGHIFFADEYLGFDDALYAAMRVLRLLARAGRSLATLLDSLPVMHSTPELRIECDDTQKFAIVGQVAARVKASGAHALDIDGVRVTTEDGWWLLRASNTQPALVARAEASTPEALARNVAALRGALEASGLAPPF